MNEQARFQGSCHCGRISFEVRGEISRAMRCTCSICSKVGALWHGTTDDGLRVLRGEEELTTYQFNTMTAKHYFCRHCGVHPFSRPRLDPTKWVANVRCIAGIDTESLPVSVFDGVDWENSAKASVARLRGSSAA